MVGMAGMLALRALTKHVTSKIISSFDPFSDKTYSITTDVYALIKEARWPMFERFSYQDRLV
jgi:hypothetical protein